jgi:hypothetical protein
MVKLFFRAPAVPGPDQPGTGQAPTGDPQQPAIPIGIQQIADSADRFMPVIEQITGLTRREISLNVMKTGLRGGSLASFLDTLTGQKPAPEAKLIKYVKTFAIWVPLSVLLFGFVLVTLFIYAKLMIHLVGTL